MMTRLKVVVLATLAFGSLAPMKPAAAALFSKADLDPSKLVLVASPYGSNAHQLLIVEQVSNNRACWSESGTSPTMIDPLLVNFDFTGICGRSTDANGYSIRMGDQDLGMQYSLRVVQRNGDLLLVGMPNTRNAPEIQIGRAGGVTNGFAKLYLNPGWRITRRVYNNQPLGHYYLTNDQPLNSAIAAAPVQPVPLPLPSQTPPTQKPSLPLPVSRPDIIFAPGSSTTTGSTTPSSPRPAGTSIPIPVPPPESVATAGSTRPAPLPVGSTTPPVTTIPVAGSKTPVRSGANQPVSSSRSPVKGKPIRVPLPTAATRPIVTAPQEAMQPSLPQPISQPPAVQSPIVQRPIQAPITQAPVTPPAASNLPKPKPGDFVVPTTTL
ncbi:MAG: DUF3747 domain-containing protein [Leptolyngbya sp. BL-A-14]